LRGRLARLVALTAVLLPAINVAPAAAHPAVVRSSLPASRLEFGLSNDDTTWMTASAVPWRYRFTYLAGGVNTTNNWLTWQDPAKPPGQFALDYMTNSTAPPANYIPVFTWYQLLQSLPSAGGNELERDYSNLNNAATMSSYYASFKVLMQKAAQYGGQVVVHVEPDFWGYMQQKAAGGSATSISAMVRSSGFGEASAFPDNVAGFASELKYLRDTYAPSVLLEMHASMWSSSIDIASDTNPNINAAAEADKTAAFLSSAGSAAWDGLFEDVDDHNAAWWELASCGTPPCVNPYFTHWWDPNNVRFPNFSRYLIWVGELHAKSGLPQVVWQVPMGNQYFLTMNNTCRHYQDNVAPYFIAHAADLYAAGLIAVLFGPGNSCQTTYDDPAGDGVTNSGGVPTTDVLGGCNACNAHASTWPDDDGGYLRIFVGEYYKACTAASVAPASLTQDAGSSVTLTASAAGCPQPSYEFWVQYPDGGWRLLRGFGAAVMSWSTAGLAPGVYTVHVWADQQGAGPYWQAIGSATVTLTGCTSAGLSPGSVTQAAGTVVTLTASSSGCAKPRYAFWVQSPDASWHFAQTFDGATFNWNTAALSPGTYTVHVWVNTQGNGYDALGEAIVTLTGCTNASVSPANPTQPAGSSITFTASATGCAAPRYAFWVQYPDASWHLARGFGGSTFTWSTAGLAPGVFTVHAWVNQTGNGYDTFGTATATLTGCTGATVSPASGSSTVGAPVVFTASATGCPLPTFEFWLQDPSGAWHFMRAYSGLASWQWNSGGWPKGTYTIHVWANQQGASLSSYEVIAAATWTLN
jgi:hypothetical protein